MKILHTSDLHLGITLNGINFIGYQQALPDIMAETVKRENIGCVIIAGDVFNRAQGSAEAYTLYDRLLTKLCTECKVPTIVISGNHDSGARISACSELVKSSGLYLFGGYSEDITPVSIENADIYPLPFFESGSVGEHLSDGDAMKQTLDSVREKMDRSRKNILVSHCFAAGGETCESDISARAAAVGGENAVPVSAFLDFDYVALGHIHRPQTVKANNLIRYSGTPFKYSFSEAEQEKSFTVYDTESGELSLVPVPDIIPLRVIKGTFDEIMKAAENDEKKDDLIKIIVTDRFAGASVYRPLKEIYPNLLQFEGAAVRAAAQAKISSRELSEMSPEKLADMYVSDRTGSEMNDEQRRWFADAVREVMKEGE